MIVSTNTLSTLSLDIIYEILSHLRPDDLLHISRVSKSFHQLLTSRRTAWIWRRTWSNAGDDIAPPLPEDISDVLAWTVLVFGGTGCQICGSEDYQEIDWALRIRACSPCTIKSVTFSVPKSIIGVRKFMPLLQVLPRSMFYPRHYRSMTWPNMVSPYFLKNDAARLAEEVDAVAVGLDPEELSAKIEELREVKALAYVKVLKHAKSCVDWAERVAKERERVYERQRAEKRRYISERLIALGYTHEETSYSTIWNEPVITSKVPWSDDLWTTVEPKFVAILEAEKVRYIQNQRRFREKLLEGEYRGLLLDKPPLSLALYPQPHELQEISSDITLICDSPLGPEADFLAPFRNVILQMFPTSIEQWATERKRKIMSTLVPPTSSGSLPIACGTFDVPFELTLAKNVYTAEAKPRTPLFGAEIFAYRHDDHEPGEPSSSSPFSALNIPSLNKDAQRTVLALLELCGLDGTTTTSQELDHLHDLFVCEACYLQAAKLQTEELEGSTGLLDFNFMGRRARMNWREALNHQLKHPEQDVPRFTRTADEINPGPSVVEVMVDFRSRAQGSYIWGCGHCAVHLQVRVYGGSQRWMERDTVIQHLRVSHGLGTREPVEGLDIYYNPSFPMAEMIRRL